MAVHVIVVQLGRTVIDLGWCWCATVHCVADMEALHIPLHHQVGLEGKFLASACTVYDLDLHAQ